MGVTVLKSGLLSTVQDLGRAGYQRYGIAVGGAVDATAARVANLLVGNSENAALLEIALIGPELRADQELLVAWCGGDFAAWIDDHPLPKERPVRVPAGSVLSFGPVRSGAMAWLAFAGGIDVPVLLGSRSTHRQAKFGGREGRGLIPGDKLALLPPSERAAGLLAELHASGRVAPTWCARVAALGEPAVAGTLRFVRGPEWDWFTEEAQERFVSESYLVTKDADRMGVRFKGPELALAAPREMISSSVNTGVVQVPPSGQPIVLSAARQTIGGYPRLAAVAAVDYPAIAQLKPGDAVRFEEVGLPEAHALLLRREQDLNRLRLGLTRLFP